MINNEPFKAFVSALALVVAAVSVAGYSFRWSYYYNFGLHSLVLSAPIDSLPVFAIEIVRTGAFIRDVLMLIVFYLVPLHFCLLLLRSCCASKVSRVRIVARIVARGLALDRPLVCECLYALSIMSIAFRAGGNAGYIAYRANITEGSSTLPLITVIAPSDSRSMLNMHCDPATFKTLNLPTFIGDADTAKEVANLTSCSTSDRSWRLLAQDDKVIYMFATNIGDVDTRPTTLVLSKSEGMSLILR